MINKLGSIRFEFDASLFELLVRCHKALGRHRGLTVVVDDLLDPRLNQAAGARCTGGVSDIDVAAVGSDTVARCRVDQVRFRVLCEQILVRALEPLRRIRNPSRRPIVAGEQHRPPIGCDQDRAHR